MARVSEPGEPQRRRPRGEGALRERKDGLWEMRVKLPGDTKITSFYGKNKTQVAAKAKRAIQKRQRGEPDKPSTDLLGDYLDGWLEHSIKPNVEASTYGSYEQSVRVHIKPHLGKLTLSQLTPEHVERWRNQLADGKRSARTVQYAYDLLRRALDQAKRRKKIAENPATLVGRPRVVREEIIPPSPEEASALLKAIKGNRLEGLILTCMGLGIRQGEALGLMWDRDIDFESRVVRVRQQLQDGSLKRTKRPRSVRTIPMPSFVHRALLQQQERQKQDRELAGDGWTETGLVFTSMVGTALDGKNVTHRFQAILKNAGLRHQRFHDLRHACASLLLAQGVHPRVVMDILGHTSLEMTMGVYSHTTLDLQREAMERLDGAMATIRSKYGERG
jgi:integrase